LTAVKAAEVQWEARLVLLPVALQAESVVILISKEAYLRTPWVGECLFPVEYRLWAQEAAFLYNLARARQDLAEPWF
jgi:hypothetical protein